MNFRFKLLIMAAVLLAAISLQGQNKSAGINLSLWKGISTQPLESDQTTYFNLGVLSAINRLQGVSINILASTVSDSALGIQVSGIANIAGGEMKGIQISGISNVSGDSMVGIGITGLINIAGNESKGLLAAGLANITGDNSKGALVSSLLNIAGNEFAGVNIAGLANIVGEGNKGVTVSGLSNVVGGSTSGVQVTGLLNITGRDAAGVQISGGMNIAGNKASGLQLGSVNMAEELNGVQVGIFNYYNQKTKGFQLGLVNANPETKVQWMFFGGNATKMNVAARFKNKLLYTILGVGPYYLDFSDKFSASAFYRAGLELPLYKKLYISGDLGFQHIELFNNKKKNEHTPARLYALQARINLEYKVSKQLGVFVTGGYGGSRYYNKARTYDKGVIIEAGIVLL
ncbi:hypothetical protein [Bacteroides sp. 519]|uniref:LA_2272 family surface repeat-containing protein n=1 Tax=Bacteroides sp. 519 TaxID=2302937 RepID=UPI003519FBAC